jgi:hypothetical protein
MRYLILILLVVGCSSVERKPTEEEITISQSKCLSDEKVVFTNLSSSQINFKCEKVLIEGPTLFKVKTRK